MKSKKTKSKIISKSKTKKSKPMKIKISAQLQKALDLFPKIVKEEERNFKARERDIRRFDELSKLLASGKIK